MNYIHIEAIKLVGFHEIIQIHIAKIKNNALFKVKQQNKGLQYDFEKRNNY